MNLHFNARNVGHLLADLLVNDVCFAAGIPIRELKLDCSDKVRTCIAVTTRAGVDRSNLVIVKETLFDLTHQCILLIDREVVTSAHLYLSKIRFNRREEAHTIPKGTIQVKRGKEHEHCRNQCRDRSQNGPVQNAHVEAGPAPHITRITPFGRMKRELVLFGLRWTFTDDAANDWNENQRHKERRGQRQDHCDRQILHELTNHAIPKEEREEHAKRRGRRSDDWPSHTLCRRGIRFFGRVSILKPTVRIFGGYNRTIHEHANNKDQSKEHNDVHRVSHDPNSRHTSKERARNGKANKDCRANTKRPDHYDHHKDNRGNNVCFKIAEHGFHLLALVLHIANGYALRPFF